VTPACLVTEGLLLDAAADPVQGIQAEPDDMEGVEHSGGLRQAGP